MPSWLILVLVGCANASGEGFDKAILASDPCDHDDGFVAAFRDPALRRFARASIDQTSKVAGSATCVAVALCDYRPWDRALSDVVFSVSSNSSCETDKGCAVAMEQAYDTLFRGPTKDETRKIEEDDLVFDAEGVPDVVSAASCKNSSLAVARNPCLNKVHTLQKNETIDSILDSITPLLVVRTTVAERHTLARMP